MHWLALAILLQDEDTGAFRIGRIIFHNDGVAASRENLLDRDSIGGKFIIPVVRHYDLLPCHQREDCLQRVADRTMHILTCVFPFKGSWSQTPRKYSILFLICLTLRLRRGK